MSLIVSASQRCSMAVVTVSRMVMYAGLRLMWVGHQGLIPDKADAAKSRDVSVKQSGRATQI
jgi:hypothetical protein